MTMYNFEAMSEEKISALAFSLINNEKKLMN